MPQPRCGSLLGGGVRSLRSRTGVAYESAPLMPLFDDGEQSREFVLKPLTHGDLHLFSQRG